MPNQQLSQVFHDPQFRRWKIFKLISQVIGFFLTIVFGVLIFSVLINPVLPSLGLSSIRTLPQAHHVFPPRQESKEALKKPMAGKTGRSLPPTSASSSGTGMVPSGSKSELIGFYVNWDDTSFTSLKQNISTLDKLIPEWLHLSTSDGTISQDDPFKQTQALNFIQKHRPDLKVVPLVNNFISERMEWDSNTLAKMLANPDSRKKTIENLFRFVQTYHFGGVSIDFENVPETSQPAFIEFMNELYARFHPLGLEVSQSVPLDDPHFDYKALVKCNDYLILMAYDEHWAEGDPGPVASQAWYSQSIQRRFSELPADKFVIAVGNYGYDWKENTKPGTEISFQEATRTAQESEGKITLDAQALNPWFDYYDEDDALHHVWFLDAVTTFNQFVEAQKYQPRGFALWRLGSEDPSVWSVFEQRTKLDQTAAMDLRAVRYGYDIDYEGEGEVLKVTALPSNGSREIVYEPTLHLITSEQLLSYASPYVITRWGGNDKKKIALTFDDGPDDRYTPQVLDVLKRYQVPGTFFVIGSNGNQHPQLLERMVNEGHEIGSHTFTHPNISVISDEQLALELSATQRMLESRLGRRTVLFRPPYAEDVEPETPDQVKPLLDVGNRGYYTIGMQIDPNDWRNPGTENIVREVLQQADSGQGNVVLLHDSGGDRSQTVAALPKIIEGLRAKGYQLVAVSDLIGVSHNAVMPAVPNSERLGAGVSDIGFALLSWAGQIVQSLFILGIILGILRLLFVGTLAVHSKFKKSRVKFSKSTSLPTVSVIVPAYNEEKVVCTTIESLLGSDYPNFNIIVVDDGSKDGTYQKAVEVYGKHPRIAIFTKENGGKAAALNFGIRQTQAEVIVALDADTVFGSDAISKLVRHFDDPQVGAVAGNAKVGNRINLLTRWQALEYITSQNMDRRAYETLNCISVVPGAIGAWRRELVEKAGGFTNQTLAEDADLTLSILRMGYRITYEEQAVAYTEAPDTVKAFVKQRFRWMFGTLQAVWKHRDALFRPRFGALGLFALPNVLLFQIFFPLISPVMDFLMVVTLFNTIWQKYQHPTDYSTDGLKRALFYYSLFVAVDFGAAFIAFALERGEEWGLLVWLFFQRFFYRQLMYYVAIKSTLTAIRGSIVGWGKLERKATVQLHASN